MDKKKKAEKPAKAAPIKKAAPAKKAAEEVTTREYHISKRAEDGKWQVRFANGQKAIKLFGTQAEAITYAKTLAKNQEGSIRIHSKKGKMRKE
jgi:hypothetical protein